jgi:Ser/Thr protein kinase RdoA (MazF antagonist)
VSGGGGQVGDSLEAVFETARKALDSWLDISGEPQLVMHRENTVFRVGTKTGPAALRIHRAGYHSHEAIKSELDWMAHLALNGLAVPAPIRTEDGALFVELDNGAGQKCVADLLTWLDGAPLGKSGQPLAGSISEQVDIFQALGKSMARLHQISDAWRRPHGFHRHAWDRDGLIGDAPFWGKFWAVSDCFTDEAEMLVKARKRVGEVLDKYDAGGADYGLIHADLVRENVLVHEGQVRMIDFDDAGYGFRMFDIATALIKNRREPHYEALKAALLSGYESLRPLSPRDLAALPLFLLLRALTYLGWAEARKHEPGMTERRQRYKTEALELARTYLARE